MAGGSLSLTAYRALTRRGTAGANDLPSHDRPKGQLVWLHLGNAADAPALRDFALRLTGHNDGPSVLFTADGKATEHTALQDLARSNGSVYFAAPPTEHPEAVAQFLDYWRPDAMVWIWGNLRPNLIQDAQDRGIAMHLFGADSAGFDGRRDRWLPELVRTLLRRFETVTARDAAGSARLARLGLPSDKIRISPQLVPTGHVLMHQPSDITELAKHLSGRPVWLAAQVSADELPIVLSAHRQALRSAQQLLLVLNLASEGDLKKAQDLLDREALQNVCWSDGQMPNAGTQVLVADLPGELGLWYRVASVSFLGSSLKSGEVCCDPMAAAALGTAILYGPNIRTHLASYSRLATAGAARIVKDASSLGSAVSRLVAPDMAAGMAHAGWDVVTEGAEAVDALITLIQDSLDAAQTKEQA